MRGECDSANLAPPPAQLPRTGPATSSGGATFNAVERETGFEVTCESWKAKAGPGNGREVIRIHYRDGHHRQLYREVFERLFDSS